MTDPLLLYFPRLAQGGYRVTSPPTNAYNCIAWAASRVDRWWWPDQYGYWPAGVPMEETLAAFQAAYATLGYKPCTSAALEAFYEKVAVYARPSGNPTHAARQLDDGKWTSKLGPDVDIEHGTPEAVGGAQYGNPVLFLRRRRPFWRALRVMIRTVMKGPREL